MHPIFHFVLDDFVEDVFEEFPEAFGTFPRLRRVFGQVLEDGPEVQERAPVDVTEIGEEDVLFVVIDEAIVAFEEEVAEVRPVWIDFNDAWSFSCLLYTSPSPRD